jgi:hypothetical protein
MILSILYINTIYILILKIMENKDSLTPTSSKNSSSDFRQNEEVSNVLE